MTANSPDSCCKHRRTAKGKATLLSHPKHPSHHDGSFSKEPNETSQQIKWKLIQYKKNNKTVTAQN